MIKIRWQVEGETRFMEEIFEDRVADRAQDRYDELVGHARCFDIQMFLVNEDDAVLINHMKKLPAEEAECEL